MKDIFGKPLSIGDLVRHKTVRYSGQIVSMRKQDDYIKVKWFETGRVTITYLVNIIKIDVEELI